MGNILGCLEKVRRQALHLYASYAHIIEVSFPQTDALVYLSDSDILAQMWSESQVSQQSMHCIMVYCGSNTHNVTHFVHIQWGL